MAMTTHRALILAAGATVAMRLSAQAGGYAGHSGAAIGAHASPHSAPSAFHSFSGSHSYTGRTIGLSQRFPAMGIRAMPGSPRLRGQRYVYSSRTISARRRQFDSRTFERARDIGMIGSNTKTRVGSIHNNGSRHFDGGSSHVFAKHSPSWHRDWDRSCDHWWHGHRCRFVNGCWFIFDFGFIPWYGWPYDYYGYGYDYYDPYSYGYDPRVYEEINPNYYDEGAHYPSDDGSDSIVADAQERLAREGYYRGEIDGVLGPEMRRAMRRYQSDHGLRETGYLTDETRQSLGLRPTPHD